MSALISSEAPQSTKQAPSRGDSPRSPLLIPERAGVEFRRFQRFSDGGGGVGFDGVHGGKKLRVAFKGFTSKRLAVGNRRTDFAKFCNEEPKTIS